MKTALTKKYKGDILLVDDTPDNLRVLTSLLEKEGYRVRKTLNGSMALIACESSLPDLILLDILMPEMDGYEVCRRLKASEKTKNVPVIFISALDSTRDKVNAFKVGGVDYISKPFQAEEVIARVSHQLTIQQQHRQLIEQNIQLQKLNEAITRYNEEIAKSNAELEQFAYMASHDLQSPLQVALGYADMLLWKYESNLNDEMKRYVGEIIKAGKRMQQLIQDLLAYSRLGAQPPQLQAADCKIALAEALNNLREEISASGAIITHSDLPIVNGDPTQLMLVFQNLISNAIKFRRPEVTPQVKISAELKSENQEWLIAVSDNGIGIESKHFELIFEVFQRLHPHTVYPGTGLGTSICKKIIERHGGKIWVESEVGVGSTFYFTLPCREEV